MMSLIASTSTSVHAGPKVHASQIKEEFGKLSSKEREAVLFEAVRMDRLDIVKLAIDDFRLSTEVRDDTEKTPLHWAVIFGRPEIAIFLIDKGADRYARDCARKRFSLNGRRVEPGDEEGLRSKLVDYEKVSGKRGGEILCTTPIGYAIDAMDDKMIRILEGVSAQRDRIPSAVPDLGTLSKE